MPDPASYHAWLDHQRRIEPPPHLADAVMAQITAAPRRVADAAWPSAGTRTLGALEWISRHPWLQAACLVGGAALGVLRVVATLQFLLSY